MTLIKVLEFMKYMDISHSIHLERMLITDLPTLWIFKMDKDMKNDFDWKNIPDTFEKYYLHSSFIVNFWKDLLVIGLVYGISVILGLCCLLFRMKKEWATLTSVFQWLKMCSLNYSIARLSSYFIDIIVFAGLEIRSKDFSKSSDFVNDLSFVISVAYIVLCIGLIGMFIWLLLKYQSLKKNQTDINAGNSKLKEFQLKYQGLRIIFEEYKKGSFIQQAFVIFCVLRAIIFGISLLILFEHPLIQASICFALSIIILAYLGVLRPFESFLVISEQIIYEIIILIVSASLLILAIFDHTKKTTSNKIYYLSEIITYSYVVFNFIITIFTAPKIWAAVNRIRKGPQKNKTLPISAPENNKQVNLVLPDSSLEADQSRSYVDLLNTTTAKNNKPGNPTIRVDHSISDVGIVLTGEAPKENSKFDRQQRINKQKSVVSKSLQTGPSDNSQNFMSMQELLNNLSPEIPAINNISQSAEVPTFRAREPKGGQNINKVYPIGDPEERPIRGTGITGSLDLRIGQGTSEIRFESIAKRRKIELLKPPKKGNNVGSKTTLKKTTKK